MGKTEFLKKDFIPEAESAGYLVVYSNLWELELDPAAALVAQLYKAIEPKGFAKRWDRLNKPIKVKKLKASGKIPGFIEQNIDQINCTLFDVSSLRGIVAVDK